MAKETNNIKETKEVKVNNYGIFDKVYVELLKDHGKSKKGQIIEVHPNMAKLLKDKNIAK